MFRYSGLQIKVIEGTLRFSLAVDEAKMVTLYEPIFAFHKYTYIIYIL